MGHQDPLIVALALNNLNNAGLLRGEAAQENRNAILGHQDPCFVASALTQLNEAGLLTGEVAQVVFNNIAITHRDILTHPETEILWETIPADELTRLRFETILTICNNNRGNPAQGRARFGDYVNREILGIGAPHTAAADLVNPT
jgi:hypothetical protein